MICKSPAIILNSRKYSDSSKIISAFTQEFGKLSFIAKGAYSNKSKFGASLEPLSYVELTFYKKHNSDLHILSACDIIQNLKALHKDMQQMSVGLSIAETIYKTQENDHANIEIWNLLLYCLKSINDFRYNSKQSLVFFWIKLAADMGFEFTFNYREEEIEFLIDKLIREQNLEQINHNLVQNYYYMRVNDCLISKKINVDDNNFIRISLKNLQFISKINEIDLELDQADKLNIDFDNFCELIDIYFAHHLGKRLNIKSLSLLDL